MIENFGKGIFPPFKNLWDTNCTESTEGITTPIEGGFKIISSGEVVRKSIATLPTGGYTVYGRVYLRSSEEGPHYIGIAGEDTNYSTELETLDQKFKIDFSISSESEVSLFITSLASSDTVEILDLNLVPQGYPNQQLFAGSSLSYDLNGSEKSTSFSLNNIASSNVGDRVICFMDTTLVSNIYVTSLTTSTFQLNISTDTGTFVTSIEDTDFITLSYPDNTTLNVYINAILVDTLTLSWDRRNLQTLEFMNSTTTTYTVDYLLFDRAEGIGFPRGSQLRRPNTQLTKDAKFKDLNKSTSRNLEKLPLVGNTYQETLPISTVEFMDLTLSEDYSHLLQRAEPALKRSEIASEGIARTHTLEKNVITRNWTSITTDYYGILYEVCYAENLGRFVAVGVRSTNNIQYSDDGVNWTSVTTDNGFLRGVCYSEHLQRFVAVGPASTNNIQYSDDGVNWTSITADDGDLRGVCYAENLQRFVAVGYGSTNNIQYSDDGVNWTSITTDDGNLHGVCYAENLQRFVAVGTAYTNNIQYSDDGVTWNSITTDHGYLIGVCYAESIQRFVAVGYRSTNNIQYSDDGITWTSITADNGSLQGVCYSEHLQRFVAVGTGSTNNIQYSDDGVTWNSITTEQGDLQGVCYSESLQRFVAVGIATTNNIQHTL